MRTVLSVSLPENMSEELDRFARSTGRNKSAIVIIPCDFTEVIDML